MFNKFQEFAQEGVYTRRYINDDLWGFADPIAERVKTLVVIEKEGLANGRLLTEFPEGKLCPLDVLFRRAHAETRGD